MYQKVDKVGLKNILMCQPNENLFKLYAHMHTKNELVSDIVRLKPEQLTQGLRSYGWCFDVVKEKKNPGKGN